MDDTLQLLVFGVKQPGGGQQSGILFLACGDIPDKPREKPAAGQKDFTNG